MILFWKQSLKQVHVVGVNVTDSDLLPDDTALGC